MSTTRTSDRRSLVHIKLRNDPDTPQSRNICTHLSTNTEESGNDEFLLQNRKSSSNQVPSNYQLVTETEETAKPPHTVSMQTTPPIIENNETSVTNKSKGVRPVTPSKVDRPKRATRMPDKLKDYDLQF